RPSRAHVMEAARRPTHFARHVQSHLEIAQLVDESHLLRLYSGEDLTCRISTHDLGAKSTGLRYSVNEPLVVAVRQRLDLLLLLLGRLAPRLEHALEVTFVGHDHADANLLHQLLDDRSYEDHANRAHQRCRKRDDLRGRAGDQVAAGKARSHYESHRGLPPR